MQPVTASYNPYPARQRVGVSILFKLVDTEAAQSATPSVSGMEPVSDLSKLVLEKNAPAGKWPALERGLWLLDGSGEALSGEQGAAGGWWGSVLSDEDAAFSSPPTLTMTLSAPASSIGFTLRFDDKAMTWPTSVRISAYRGETLLEQQTIDNNRPLLVADMPVESYDRVEFDFLAMCMPSRRVRLYSVLFGQVQQFDAGTVVKATWNAGCSPACKAIPSREVTFTFDNSDLKYNMINPTGLYRYLQDGQVIQTALIMDGEAVDMGEHYFQKAQAQDDALTAEITANDRLFWLDTESYDGGTSGYWLLSAALAAVLGPDIALDLPADLAARTVGQAIPVGTSKREAVRLLAQAARCTCWINRASAFVFRDLAIGTPVDTLTRDELDSMDGISVSDKITCVQLTVRDEFAGMEEVIYTAGSGSYVFTADNPCAADGQAVADWLLAVKQRRLVYECPNRGNPAVELGDTITIYNAYGEAGDAAVYEFEMEYNGDLRETTKALGEAWS